MDGKKKVKSLDELCAMSDDVFQKTFNLPHGEGAIRCTLRRSGGVPEHFRAGVKDNNKKLILSDWYVDRDEALEVARLLHDEVEAQRPLFPDFKDPLTRYTY